MSRYLPGEASSEDALSGVQPAGQPPHMAAALDTSCQYPGAAEGWGEQHTHVHPHALSPAQCTQHGMGKDHSHLNPHVLPLRHLEAPGQDAEATLRSWERLIHGSPAAPEQPQHRLHAAAYGQGPPGDGDWRQSSMHAAGMPAGGPRELSGGALCGEARGVAAVAYVAFRIALTSCLGSRCSWPWGWGEIVPKHAICPLSMTQVALFRSTSP